MSEKYLSIFQVAMTTTLALSAAYSAFSAMQSAETAEESAALSRDSVAIAREWLESSERALVAPKEWSIVGIETDPLRVVIQAQLQDIADVPTTISKVCVW